MDRASRENIRGCVMAQPALFMKLLQQARIRGCDGQSRRSALRHTTEYAAGLYASERRLTSRLHAFATNLHE
jgi:hypothetical protein